MPRSLLNAVVAFGDVAVPVQLHSATTSERIHFHEVHLTDGGRIEHRRFCVHEDKEVPYDEIVKGHEISDGEYAVLTTEQLAAPTPDGSSTRPRAPGGGALVEAAGQERTLCSCPLDRRRRSRERTKRHDVARTRLDRAPAATGWSCGDRRRRCRGLGRSPTRRQRAGRPPPVFRAGADHRDDRRARRCAWRARTGAHRLHRAGAAHPGQRSRLPRDRDPPPTDGLEADVDLYCDDAERLATKLTWGDDFAHWSLWYGCVLLDDGTLQRAAASIAAQDAWPDAGRKLRQAREGLGFAERLVDSGDREAATEQVRGLCTLTARWLLLAHEIFPLSRDELAGQLADLGCAELAAALDRSIHCAPELSSRPGFAWSSTSRS